MDDRGYQVLRAAIDEDGLAAYARERAAERAGLLVRERLGAQVELSSNASDEAGVVDPYAILPAARALLLPRAVTDLLGEPALLFDAAESAAAVLEDGPYRDETHVAAESLTTVVVALGDDAALDVFPGSAAIETTPFSGRYRHFNPERDGDAALERHHEELAAALGEPERVALAAGDVVILDGATVHRAAEGPVLVAHLCPSRVSPGWFAYRPERARHASYDDGRAWLATQHYDLVDAVTPEEAPAPEAELERVEETLREHDQELATEPTPPAPPDPPGAPRRSGGLVDSVRGILGRRGGGRR